MCSSMPDSSKALTLAYQIYEGDKQDKSVPILVIHGMFGSTINWHSFCKSYTELTGRKVIAVDLRNHGQSPRSDHMNFPLMARDVAETLKDMNISKSILIGHSVGGKVAMELALSMPSIVERLIIEDTLPFAVPVGGIPLLISLMLNTDLSLVKSQREADDLLSKSLPDVRNRAYILQNMQENAEGKFHWLTNLKGVEENLEELLNPVELNGRLPYQGETLFIGGDSGFLSNVDMNEMRKMFPKAELEIIQGVGHYVHTDKPKEFLEIVHNFLK